MSRPDWKDAPDWANYLATDDSGDCHWYETYPQPDDDIKRFKSYLGRCQYAGHIDLWKMTLQDRPTNRGYIINQGLLESLYEELSLVVEDMSPLSNKLIECKNHYSDILYKSLKHKMELLKIELDKREESIGDKI